MLNVTINQFVKQLGLNTETMQPGDVFDVSNLNYYTSSFDFEQNKVVKKKVLNIKYQGPKEVYEIVTPKSYVVPNTTILKASQTHHLYDWARNNWIEVGKVKTVSVKFQEDIVKCSIKKTEIQAPMFDLEVEDLHNYYTNQLLSKNCTGGEAVNFFPSTRCRVTPKEQLTKNGEIVGIKMKIKNYKNKTGIPNRECFLDVYFKDGDGFKKGIDADGQYLDMALELGVIIQHGAWFYYKEGTPDMIKMQGWGGVQQWFEEHTSEFQVIKNMVDAKLSGFDEHLDKNTVEVDEEVEFQKEQLETKAKREAAVAALAEAASEDDVQGEN